MRRIAFIAALGAGIALAGPGTAAACPTGPALPYDSGGAPRAGFPNDPLFDRQWGLEQIRAPQAWAVARGAGVTIAIVDTGVDLRHPDLASKSLPGMDLVASDACGQDEEGHGTHVAGIAAAEANNGVGVAGVAPDASILPVRVLNAAGDEGREGLVAQGIRQAADSGAQVINLSLGGLPVVGELQEVNEEIEAAVEYAFSRGSVVVAAAGNESLPLCSYPAAAPRAICVAANDRAGAPAYYSNLPAGGTTLAVRAPGGTGALFCEDDEDVWSTIWPSSESDATCQPGGIRGYETLSGTSMASPHVAGVAALLVGKGLTNGQVLECLRTTSSGEGSYDPVHGYGTVNAEAAVNTCSKDTTPTTPGGAPPPATGSGADRSGPVIRLRVRRLTRRELLRRKRFAVETSSNEAAKVLLSASLKGRQRLARRRVSFDRAGTKRVVVRITRRGLAALRRARRSKLVLLSWRATDLAGNTRRGRVRIPLRTR